MSTLSKTFLAIIARFRSRSGNYREKTVDIFHGDRTEEKFERSKDRCFEYDEREKKKKKKMEGPTFSIIKTSFRQVCCLFNCKKKKRKKEIFNRPSSGFSKFVLKSTYFLSLLSLSLSPIFFQTIALTLADSDTRGTPVFESIYRHLDELFVTGQVASTGLGTGCV